MKCDPYNVSRWYADEAAVALRDEFEKMEKSGMTRDEAMKKLRKAHTEFDEATIDDAIENGSDLEF